MGHPVLGEHKFEAVGREREVHITPVFVPSMDGATKVVLALPRDNRPKRLLQIDAQFGAAIDGKSTIKVTHTPVTEELITDFVYAHAGGTLTSADHKYSTAAIETIIYITYPEEVRGAYLVTVTSDTVLTLNASRKLTAALDGATIHAYVWKTLTDAGASLAVDCCVLLNDTTADANARVKGVITVRDIPYWSIVELSCVIGQITAATDVWAIIQWCYLDV